MASEVVRDLADTIIGASTSASAEAEDIDSNHSAETVRARDSMLQLGNTSSYLLTADDSVFSRDVDHWIRGDSPTDTGVQRSRYLGPRTSPLSRQLAPFYAGCRFKWITTVQRSTLVTSSSLDARGVWYLAAMVLPFMSINNTMLWRCTPSTVLSSAELLLTHVTRLCGTARSRLRRLAREQALRDIFAAAMDLVLAIYAMGFLVISMYQASIIGQ